MIRDVKCVAQDASVEEAAETLLQERINCLLVLSDSGHIDGMVTTKDVLKQIVGAAKVVQSPV